MMKLIQILFAIAFASIMVAHPVSAGALTTVIEDPVGDAVALGGAAYQDIVRAEISKRDGVFVFVMELAAPIPASPTLPPGVKLQEWVWNLDTDPATFPRGFPVPPGVPIPPEFSVTVLWDGTTFTGSVIDRRPLLTGGDPIITTVPFDIKGAEVKASADAGLLDSPSSFTVVCRTQNWNSHLGSRSMETFDHAPDAGRAPWPP